MSDDKKRTRGVGRNDLMELVEELDKTAGDTDIGLSLEIGLWQKATAHEDVRIVLGFALRQDAVRTSDKCRQRLKEVLAALKAIADGGEQTGELVDAEKCRAAVFGVLIAQKVQLTSWTEFTKGLDDADNGTVSAKCVKMNNCNFFICIYINHTHVKPKDKKRLVGM